MWEMLLPAAASIAGSLLNKSSNDAAADKAQHAAEIEAQSIREGRAAAERELERVRSENEGGQSYLRQVVAGSGELTPAQRMQLEELRRTTGNQIRTSAIAGSGRTAAGLLRRTEAEFTNDALERNRARAYDAASGMAGRVAQASSGVANIEASLTPKIGQALATGQLTGANADLASGQAMGKGFGQIASLITRENKPTRYPSKLYSYGSEPSPYESKWSGGSDVGSSAY